MFKDILKATRRKRGLSARQLSDLAGLSPSYVSKLESGRTEPTVRNFYRLCRALQLRDQEVLILLKLFNEE